MCKKSLSQLILIYNSPPKSKLANHVCWQLVTKKRKIRWNTGMFQYLVIYQDISGISVIMPLWAMSTRC